MEAEGKRAINEASNLLSVEQIAMQVRIALIEHLPDIIRESVKPVENIDGIKIYHIDGLGKNGGGTGVEGDGGTGSLAEQVVNSALRYRSQAPLIDMLMAEIGLTSGDVHGLTRALHTDGTPSPADSESS